MAKKTKKNDGTLYERYVAQRLAQMGFLYVSLTKESGDFGADIICYDLWFQKVVVQCKYYSKPVGVPAIQEVNAARQYYKANRAIAVTNMTFTKAAKILAQHCGVELVEKFR